MLTVALRKFSVKARHPVRVAVWCFAPVGIPRCAGGVGEGWGEKGGDWWDRVNVSLDRMTTF